MEPDLYAELALSQAPVALASMAAVDCLHHCAKYLSIVNGHLSRRKREAPNVPELSLAGDRWTLDALLVVKHCAVYIGANVGSDRSEVVTVPGMYTNVVLTVRGLQPRLFRTRSQERIQYQMTSPTRVGLGIVAVTFRRPSGVIASDMKVDVPLGRSPFCGSFR